MSRISSHLTKLKHLLVLKLSNFKIWILRIYAEFFIQFTRVTDPVKIALEKLVAKLPVLKLPQYKQFRPAIVTLILLSSLIGFGYLVYDARPGDMLFPLNLVYTNIAKIPESHRLVKLNAQYLNELEVGDCVQAVLVESEFKKLMPHSVLDNNLNQALWNQITINKPDTNCIVPSYYHAFPLTLYLIAESKNETQYKEKLSSWKVTQSQILKTKYEKIQLTLRSNPPTSQAVLDQVNEILSFDKVYLQAGDFPQLPVARIVSIELSLNIAEQLLANSSNPQRVNTWQQAAENICLIKPTIEECTGDYQLGLWNSINSNLDYLQLVLKSEQTLVKMLANL